MSSQTVNVKVSFTAPSTFHFTPDSVTLKGAGKVFLHQDPGDAPWQFVSATVPTGGSQFTRDESSNGQLLKIDDACLTPGTYAYTVTVTQDGHSYSSADNPAAVDPPRIQNDPSFPEVAFVAPMSQPPRVQNDMA